MRFTLGLLFILSSFQTAFAEERVLEVTPLEKANMEKLFGDGFFAYQCGENTWCRIQTRSSFDGTFLEVSAPMSLENLDAPVGFLSPQQKQEMLQKMTTPQHQWMKSNLGFNWKDLRNDKTVYKATVQVGQVQNPLSNNDVYTRYFTVNYADALTPEKDRYDASMGSANPATIDLAFGRLRSGQALGLGPGGVVLDGNYSVITVEPTTSGANLRIKLKPLQE
ncbi:MAG: hypothetical protein AB7O96_02840 [Pseudobdellovibrionaceae bacterium]